MIPRVMISMELSSALLLPLRFRDRTWSSRSVEIKFQSKFRKHVHRRGRILRCSTSVEGGVLDTGKLEGENWRAFELGDANFQRRDAVQVGDEGGGRGQPLLDAVTRAAELDVASFHFPGHRRGLGAPSSMLDMVGVLPFAHDLPELPELDNLFSPEGVIAQAQSKAAALFGADATFFLVNGSTCGIQASVLATCGPGDYLILPRNSHISATSAMVLSGAKPRYVAPIYDPEWGVAHGVTAQAMEEAILEIRETGGRIGAALIVSPTYFGVCSPVDELADVCHRHGVPLIVDEAHGAHFKFCEDLPSCALEQGSDLVVQSTHKVLGSLTQSSMLHSRGSRVSHELLSKCLQMVQSSSPSYLLLSSLDAARAQMDEGGKTNTKLREAIGHAMRARELLKSVPSLLVMDADSLVGEVRNHLELDPLRITVGLWNLTIGGYEADDILRLEFGVIAEMPLPETITFAISLGTCRRDTDRLVESLRYLASRYSTLASASRPGQGWSYRASSSKSGLSPRDAFFCNTRSMSLDDSLGEVSAEMVCPYPPGIPMITPGEIITENSLRQLKEIVDRGQTIVGASDPHFRTIKVCLPLLSRRQTKLEIK